MKTMPKITVYITNHNYGRYLKKSIESVLKQKYSDWELIVIDDGSTDNSRSVLKRFEKHTKVEIVYQKNKGLNISNNIALRSAKGKYIMRLDADDYLDENALLVLANVLDQHPEIALVYPDYYRIEEDGTIIDIQRRNKLDKEIKLYDMPAHGACTLIRKQNLIEIGGYGEDVRCQDGYDLWVKFIGKYKVYNVNIPLFYYRQHGVNLTKDEDAILEARYKIKRREAALRIKHKDVKVLGIVPVRGEVHGEAGYAMKKIHNKPLIDYTIKAAKASSALKDIVVVSEDRKVLSYARKKFSNIIAIKRPEKFGRLNYPIESTVKHVLSTLKKKGKCYDAFMLLYANCPLRRHMHIQKAVDTMVLFNTDCVISVYQDASDHYQHMKNGLVPLFPKRLLRLEREALLVANGAIYLAKTKQMTKKDFLKGKAGHIVMTRNESFKINNNDDWSIVEHIMENRKK